MCVVRVVVRPPVVLRLLEVVAMPQGRIITCPCGGCGTTDIDVITGFIHGGPSGRAYLADSDYDMERVEMYWRLADHFSALAAVYPFRGRAVCITTDGVTMFTVAEQQFYVAARPFRQAVWYVDWEPDWRFNDSTDFEDDASRATLLQCFFTANFPGIIGYVIDHVSGQSVRVGDLMKVDGVHSPFIDSAEHAEMLSNRLLVA